MIKRTLIFSSSARLYLKNKQLICENRETGDVRSVPIEDIGFVVLENHEISITLPLLDAMTNNNVAVTICDNKHMPTSMLLNLDGNRVQTELFSGQIKAGVPLKKNLWQQTVTAKIRNQASLLNYYGLNHSELQAYVKDVKSGDTTNREGAAARIYWKRLFGDGFERNRYGVFPNNMLNYGYIVLRAAVARGLSGSGLLPTLGIHHHNRYNSFCLADDIMEPYRTYVDRHVFEIYKTGCCIDELNTETKMNLLDVLTTDVNIDKNKRPLMIAITHTTASLARCFVGLSKKIVYPVM